MIDRIVLAVRAVIIVVTRGLVPATTVGDGIRGTDEEVEHVVGVEAMYTVAFSPSPLVTSIVGIVVGFVGVGRDNFRRQGPVSGCN
jgi:hypothetical protein